MIKTERFGSLVCVCLNVIRNVQRSPLVHGIPAHRDTHQTAIHRPGFLFSAVQTPGPVIIAAPFRSVRYIQIVEKFTLV